LAEARQHKPFNPESKRPEEPGQIISYLYFRVDYPKAPVVHLWRKIHVIVIEITNLKLGFERYRTYLRLNGEEDLI